MPLCRRLTATIALSFQLIVTSVGALSACVDRPHMHGGTQAPDCVMHHQGSHDHRPPPAATPASEHHHAHEGAHSDPASSAAPDGLQITCDCSSDLMSFLVGDAAPLPDAASVPSTTVSAAIVSLARTPIDFRVAPALRPPRALPS